MERITIQDRGGQEMREFIEKEAEFIFEKMRENIGDAYWQGRLDSLAVVLKNLPEEAKR
jgi:hypothetical protein